MSNAETYEKLLICKQLLKGGLKTREDIWEELEGREFTRKGKLWRITDCPPLDDLRDLDFSIARVKVDGSTVNYSSSTGYRYGRHWLKIDHLLSFFRPLEMLADAAE